MNFPFLWLRILRRQTFDDDDILLTEQCTSRTIKSNYCHTPPSLCRQTPRRLGPVSAAPLLRVRQESPSIGKHFTVIILPAKSFLMRSTSSTANTPTLSSLQAVRLQIKALLALLQTKVSMHMKKSWARYESDYGCRVLKKPSFQIGNYAFVAESTSNNSRIVRAHLGEVQVQRISTTNIRTLPHQKSTSQYCDHRQVQYPEHCPQEPRKARAKSHYKTSSRNDTARGKTSNHRKHTPKEID